MKSLLTTYLEDRIAACQALEREASDERSQLLYRSLLKRYRSELRKVQMVEQIEPGDIARSRDG